MRTTLDIDADILKAAGALAEAERKTLGQMLSDLVRKGLEETAERGGLGGGLAGETPAGPEREGAGKRRKQVSHAHDTRHRR
jgi:hypothetical protein